MWKKSRWCLCYLLIITDTHKWWRGTRQNNGYWCSQLKISDSDIDREFYSDTNRWQECHCRLICPDLHRWGNRLRTVPYVVEFWHRTQRNPQQKHMAASYIQTLHSVRCIMFIWVTNVITGETKHFKNINFIAIVVFFPRLHQFLCPWGQNIQNNFLETNTDNMPVTAK